MENALSISRLFGESWSLFKQHWKFTILVSLMVMGVQLILSSFGYNVDPVTQVATGSLLVTGIGALVSLVLGIGMIDIFLGVTRGEKRSLKELVTTVTVRKVWVYFIASIIYAVMLFVGFILLIIPAFFVLATFLPFTYFIVDKNAGIIDSLKMAAEATKGNRVSVFLIFVSIMVLNIAGAIPFGLGLIITIPLTILITTMLYRHLIGDVEVAPEVIDAEVVEDTDKE